MVKCADCGFLATRNMQTRELCEMEYDFRFTDYYLTTSEMLKIYDYPVCFLKKADLQAELGTNPLYRTKCIFKVVNSERQCKSFSKWHQGLTPKEHKEMLDEHWDDIKHFIEIIIIGIFGLAATGFGALITYLLTK